MGFVQSYLGMNPIVLGGLLKRAYPNFDMLSFDNRLKLQKYVYLMQAFGLNIGYNFFVYLHGPYCPELTRAAYQMPDFREIKLVRFKEADTEEKFKTFLKFFSPHKNDTVWLEIAASLHIFKHILPNASKDQIIKNVREKKAFFYSKEKQIDEVWTEMERRRLL